MYILHFLVAACKFHFFFSRENGTIGSYRPIACWGLCFWKETIQFILLFRLFLLLFMSPTALFGTIHESHYIISANFYLYLQYFQQKVFNFSKISRSQTEPKTSYITKSLKKIELFFLIIIASFTNCMRHSIDYSLYAFKTF